MRRRLFLGSLGLLGFAKTSIQPKRTAVGLLLQRRWSSNAVIAMSPFYVELCSAALMYAVDKFTVRYGVVPDALFIAQNESYTNSLMVAECLKHDCALTLNVGIDCALDQGWYCSSIQYPNLNPVGVGRWSGW